jgi:hypothetical protein
VFYGKTYRRYWEAIADSPFAAGPNTHFEVIRTRTLFVLAPHPAAKGVTNEEFRAIGELIAQAERS